MRIALALVVLGGMLVAGAAYQREVWRRAEVERRYVAPLVITIVADTTKFAEALDALAENMKVLHLAAAAALISAEDFARVFMLDDPPSD